MRERAGLGWARQALLIYCAISKYVSWEHLEPQHACGVHITSSNPMRLPALTTCMLAVVLSSFAEVTECKDFTQASFDCLKRILTHMQVRRICVLLSQWLASLAA